MENKNVSILIPNWNGRELLEKNLPAVMRAAENLGTDLHEIIIVDDGSTDDSVAFLRTHYPLIRVHRQPRNLGFHHAVNTGLRVSTGNIIILLNTDVEPDPNAFTPFLPHFDNPFLFGVSGKIFNGEKTTFLYGNRGGVFRHGHFSLKEKPESDTSSQNLFVCGGAGAFSRDKFMQLGGFDRLYYPFYYEEQDVSYRALKRGWKIAYEPQSIMYHQIQGTIGKRLNNFRISLISARNNYLFSIKNITDSTWTIEQFIFIPLFLIRDLFRLRIRFILAFFMAIPRIPHAIISRYKEKAHHVITDREILKSV